MIPQEGEEVHEIEFLKPVKIIHTPKGETVIDFGQNIAGYVRFRVCGNSGDRVEISHAEILDKDGNFYTDNLRSAKQKIVYICDGTPSVYQPHHTFQGFDISGLISGRENPPGMILRGSLSVPI